MAFRKTTWLLMALLIWLHQVSEAQIWQPRTVHIAYFGETITHPGLTIGTAHSFLKQEKIKFKKNGLERSVRHYVDLNTSLGFYHHQDYQVGLFLLPQLNYERKNRKGGYISVGLGTGYLRTIIPKVYNFSPNGEIERLKAGYNYWLRTGSLAFGKDLSSTNNIPIEIFVKPQIMYATPNASKGVWYFTLEVGVKYGLAKNRTRH